MNTTTILARVPVDLRDSVKVQAQKRGITVSEFIRMSLSDYLEIVQEMDRREMNIFDRQSITELLRTVEGPRKGRRA